MRSFLLNPQTVDRSATLASLAIAFAIATAFCPLSGLVYRFGGALRGTRPGSCRRSADHFSTKANFSFRCVQGAAATMYLGSHEGGQGNKLRVFAWSESSTAVTSKVVPHFVRFKA